MKTNPSETANYNIIKKGIYISRIDEDITTYDIRVKEPNREPVLTNSAIHTTEHIFNLFIKNAEFKDNFIYFGPSASRTGYKLIVRNLSDKYIVQFIKDGFKNVSEFWGRIPRASTTECGNCLEHNLPQAKEEAKQFLEAIKDWTKDDLEYPVEQAEDEE